MAEEKKYIDKAGLEAFWASVENALTRLYQNIPEGKQIARVYQKNGRLHVEVEDFGGATDEAKKAARASLKVGIYYGSMTVADINQYTSERKFNHGDTVTADDSGIVHNGRYNLTVNSGDTLIRDVIEGAGGQKIEFWQQLAYSPVVENVDETSSPIDMVTSVTQNPDNRSQITVKTRRNVGLVYNGESGANKISFG